MKTVDRRKEDKEYAGERCSVTSQLRQWPIQLHLVNPSASYFNKADLIIAADCTAYAYGNFHQDFLKGKSLIIACPKLDQGIERYIEKMSQIIKNGKINTITAVIMEVPCCSGLLRIIEEGIKKSGMKVPVKKVVIGLEGEVLSEEWV